MSPFQAVERPYARGTAQPPPAIPGWLSPPRYWSRAVAVTLVLFAVIPMRVAELYPPLAHIKPAILASLFGFGLLWAYTSARGRRALWRDRQFQVALLFYAMALGSGLFALYKKAAFDGLQNLFFALIPLAAFLLVSPRAVQYEKLRRGMFIVATLYGLAVAAQGHVVEGSRLSTRGMFDPNDLCAVLVPMVALALASVTRGRMWERVMGAVAVGSLTYVIGQTASRGGFLGLVVAVLVFAAALDAKRTLVAMVAIVVGAIGLWQFGPEKFRERIGGMTEMNDDYNMTREEGRIQIWKRGLGYVADRPFLGVGINNMAEAEGRRLAQLGMHGKWWPAHNAFLQALVETGVLGGPSSCSWWPSPGAGRRLYGDPVRGPPGSCASLAQRSWLPSQATMRPSRSSRTPTRICSTRCLVLPRSHGDAASLPSIPRSLPRLRHRPRRTSPRASRSDRERRASPQGCPQSSPRSADSPQGLHGHRAAEGTASSSPAHPCGRDPGVRWSADRVNLHSARSTATVHRSRPQRLDEKALPRTPVE